MSSPFQFKQFTIQQEKCAMKVGTDGVLLGAWTTIPQKGNLLDIGCGTGLIALMLAQRSNNTIIDAIDIDKDAYLQTIANIKNSKWKNQVTAFHCSIQNFIPKKKYALIITNPPYFINSSKAPNNSRNTARHNDQLSYSDLIYSVIKLLNPNGTFSLILPVTESIIFTELANTQKLYCTRKCNVKPSPIKDFKRVLMEFSLHQSTIKEEKIVIETEKRHQYSKEYINLTEDFYLYT